MFEESLNKCYRKQLENWGKFLRLSSLYQNYFLTLLEICNTHVAILQKFVIIGSFLNMLGHLLKMDKIEL